MKLNLIQRRAFTVLSTVLTAGCIAHSGSAAPIDWRGGDLFWSTPGNWSPLGPPGTNDDVRFFDPGAAIDTATINNSVSSDITVRSLWFGNTNGFHNMLIEPGVTLTVRGTNDNGYGRLGSDPNATAPNPNVQSTLYVGTKSEVAVNTVVTANIRGDGTLRLDNTNNEVNVRQAWGAGGGAHRSVLDMSGLGTFVANLSRIRVGDGEAGAIRRTEGQLILAKTNRITLSGPSVAEDVQLLVGNADVNNNGNGSISYLVLGQDNVLNVDHVLVGARKQQGNIHFLETLSGPSLIMRGSDGLSRVTAIRIGDESDQANSGNPTAGRIDLNSGTVDIRADTIIVGKGQQQTGREAIGFLTLGAGSLDVNTIELAYQTSETANNRVDGTATFNGTAVTVNNMLRLGRSAGAPFPRNAVLNINGGSVNVANRLVTEGTATINVTNGLLALSGGSPVQATTLVIDGGVVSNASTINVTNSLRVANFGSILGNPICDLGNSGSATWDVQAINGGALTVSNALRGSGTVIGDLIQAPGAAISPGGDGTPGRLSIQAVTLGGNLTSEGGTLVFDLSGDALGTNDQIVINGALQLNATNDVKLTALSGGFDIFNPYTLITSGFLAGDQNYFRVSGTLAQSRYTFTFDTAFTPNSLLLFVGGSGPANLTWVGDGTANRWDLKGAANWTLGGPSAEQFYSLDAVTFNDFGSVSPTVALVGTLNAGSITVDNPTKNYVFGGAGGVQGAPLTKQGGGSLTFNNTGDNSFGGAVTIWDGTVTLSNVGLNTFVNGLAINGGSLTLTGNNANSMTGGELSIAAGASLTAANASGNDLGSGLINLDGTLTINQAADSTLNGSLTGGGTLIKAGSGTLTLAKDNGALSSVIQINGGTVKAGALNSLGVTGAAVANGGTLNLNGQSLGALPVTVSGPGAGNNGALVNTAAPQVNALANVTLQGNTTFGGSGPWNTDPVLNRGRWDIRNGSLNTLGQAVNLTKVGSNQVTLAGTTIDPALAAIDVQQGLLAFEGNTTSMGEPSSTLTVRVSATISFFDTTTAWNKKFILFGNNVTPTLLNWNGANTIAGPITLNGNCVVGGVPPDRGTPVSLTLSGPIDGGGGLTKVSADRLVLSGSYTYGGETAVNAGTLALADDGSIPNSPQISIQAGAIVDVTGTFGGALTLVGGQRLQGNGSIIGNLIAGAGSTVSPGLRSSIGDLTVTGDISLQGTTVMELNAALDTNDVLRGASIAFAGTLRFENLAGTPGIGDSFKVFDAAFYSGSFATIIPATPGAGLAWDVSTLGIDGTLRVKSGQQQPQITTTRLSGGALIFGGGGGTPNAAYYVLSSTNLSASPIVWMRILTNNFDASGNFSVTNIVNINTPQRFFILEVP